MVRECVAMLVLALCPACSLILNFDEGPPADAAVDAVYTQTECDFMEPNDTAAEAMMVTTGQGGPGAICAPEAGAPEDRDFYRFTATGAMATISINFVQRAGGDLDLKLYDATGTMIAQSRGFTSTETIVCPGVSPACPTLAAADYTFEVLPGVAMHVNSYTYSITQ